MKKILLLLSSLIISFTIAYAQQEEPSAVMRFIGVTDIEDLDAQEMERLSEYLQHPFKLNYARRTRLLSSGLFTPYQVETLLDYICTSGDILSIIELSSIDGFGKEDAAALEPFISFESSSLPGAIPDTIRRWSTSLIVRGSIRGTEDKRGAENKYGFKCTSSYGDRIIMNFGGSNSFDDKDCYPSLYTGSLTYYGRRYKLILGDYNARFGQGMALWSGFSLSTYVEPSSFYRRASGLSPINSFTGTGSKRGAAADFTMGRFVVSAFASADNLKEIMEGKKHTDISISPGINITFMGKKGKIGLTGQINEGGKAGIAASDASINVRGADCFTEAAYDIGLKRHVFLLGSIIPFTDNIKTAFVIKYIEKQMHIATLSSSYTGGRWISLKGKTGFGSSVTRNSCTFNIDAEYLPTKKDVEAQQLPIQYKALARYNMQISPSIAFGVRITERYRTYDKLKYRTDARTDIKYMNGNWMASFRGNLLNCRSLGALAYLETGYKSETFSAYIRGAVFNIDSWDDRIYVYERDAPGSFNVPAYYGKGTTISAVTGLKPRWGNVKMRFYLRAAIKNKPGKAELKLQCMFDI